MPRLTEEQLAARRGFIGASDIGAIAGLNPYRDAFDVLNEKLGFETEGGDNESAEWGHRLEPVIRQWYTTVEPDIALAPCGTVHHPTETWAAATLDSKIAGTRRGLEIKAVGSRMVYDWDTGDDEGVPHYVRCQAAWQMWVISLDEIDVAALLGGTVARVWRIARDPELEKHLVAIGAHWWRDHVSERKAPALTDAEGVRAYLNHKYPPLPEPVIVEADASVTSLVLAREESIATSKTSDATSRKATAEIVAWLGERQATDVRGDGWEFRFRVRKDGDRRPYFKRKDSK